MDRPISIPIILGDLKNVVTDSACKEHGSAKQVSAEPRYPRCPSRRSRIFLPLCLLSLDSESTSTVCIWSRLSKLWMPAHCGFFDIFDFLPLIKNDNFGYFGCQLSGDYGLVGGEFYDDES